MPDIDEILRHYPPDCQSSRPESLGSAGGLSGAQFWRLVAPRGALALRCWPIEHPTPDGLRFIHAVLRHAQERGMTILPVPLPTTTGDTFVEQAGRLWELSPWLPGVADYQRAPSVEKLRAAMIALAQFHVATSNVPSPLKGGARGGLIATAPAVANRLARLNDLRSGGKDVLSRSISDKTWPDLAPLARKFLAALPRALPAAIARLAPLADVALSLNPCIRDVWHDHVLFTGDRVTGLIDFGAMQIDTPATDIARLVSSLADCSAEFDTWPTALAAYSTIRPLSDAEIAATHALDSAGTILAGCNWIQWIFIDGRDFEDPARITERFKRVMNRLQTSSRNEY